MPLSKQEEILLKNSNGNFTLNRNRVQYTGKNLISSIPTKKITSIKIHRKSEPLILAFSAISLIICVTISINTNITGLLYFGIIISGFLALMYHLSKEQILKISSPSAAITIKIKNKTHQESIDLIDQIQEAIP